MKKKTQRIVVVVLALALLVTVLVPALSILTSALDEWNSTHDTPLAEADGTPVSFPNN